MYSVNISFTLISSLDLPILIHILKDYDLKSDYRFLTCKLGFNIHTIKSHDRIINFNHH